MSLEVQVTLIILTSFLSLVIGFIYLTPAWYFDDIWEPHPLLALPIFLCMIVPGIICVVFYWGYLCVCSLIIALSDIFKNSIFFVSLNSKHYKRLK